MLWPEAEAVTRYLKDRQDLAKALLMSIREHSSLPVQGQYENWYKNAFSSCTGSSKWIQRGVWLCQLLFLAQSSGYKEVELFELLRQAPTIVLLCLECFIEQQTAVDKLMDHISHHPRPLQRTGSLWFVRDRATRDAIFMHFLVRGTCQIKGEQETRAFQACAKITVMAEHRRSYPPAFEHSISDQLDDEYYAVYTAAATPEIPLRLPRYASCIRAETFARRKMKFTARYIVGSSHHSDIGSAFEELEDRAREGEVEQLMAFGRSCASLAFINIEKNGKSPLKIARKVAEAVGQDNEKPQLPHEVGIFEVPWKEV